jgi:hypothetical protein
MSISINNDGTYCSEVATCPSGMECSPDGYCLFPCPEAGCTGDRCGCEYRDDLSAPRVCGDDGYCHVACRAEPTFCNDNRSCDAETGHCVLPCAITADCANGAVCVPTQDPEGYAFSVCRAP